MQHQRKKLAVALSVLMTASAVTAKLPQTAQNSLSASAAMTLSDMPSEYQYAADWIWTNRISNEDSTGSKSRRYNVLFDQIIAGKGTLNYVVRWQSYKQVTLAQRQAFEVLVEDSINAWTDYLVGYENWPYDHVNVEIVGWAVLDANSILDRQPDEVVWDNLHSAYDPQYDTSNGYEEIPTVLPSAPEELWSFNYFGDRSHVYPGTRFDMYLWCTQGWPDVGGCGGDWGQRLSDNAYLGMVNGNGFPHVHIHEVGHGFGMTDFYGGEGASDGYPPGGFPGGSSIMMAGSSSVITDFDGWMLRYMWSKVSQESGRFDLANAIDPNTTTPAVTTTTTTTTTTVTTTGPIGTTVPGDVVSLPVNYDANNQYWLVDTNGANQLTLEAIGLPWAGLSGEYGYWDSVDGAWITGSFEYSSSLGEDGIETIEIVIPAEDRTTQLQIQVYYYAQWSNEANDMVAQDPSNVIFNAYGVVTEESETTTTITTTTTTIIETTTTTTTTTETTTATDEIPTASVLGDVNCNGQVRVNDVILLNRFIAEDTAAKDSVSAQGLVNADFNVSGAPNGEDSTAILRYLAGFGA